MDAFPTPEADSFAEREMLANEATERFDIALGNLRALDRKTDASLSELRKGVNSISAVLLVSLIFTGAWVFYGAPAYERIGLINQETLAWNR